MILRRAAFRASGFSSVEPARITDHGQRWLEQRYDENARFNATLADVAYLAVTGGAGSGAASSAPSTPRASPETIANGISQLHDAQAHGPRGEQDLVHDAGRGERCRCAPPIPPRPAQGASQAEATYTGYGRQTLIGTAFVAATIATPSVSLNAGTITFGACTAGTNTLLGFTLCGLGDHWWATCCGSARSRAWSSRPRGRRPRSPPPPCPCRWRRVPDGQGQATGSPC